MSAARGVRRPRRRLLESFVAHAAALGWSDASRFEGDLYMALGDYRLAATGYGPLVVWFPRGEGSELVSSVEEATAVVEQRRGEGLLDRLWREHIEREAG